MYPHSAMVGGGTRDYYPNEVARRQLSERYPAPRIRFLAAAASILLRWRDRDRGVPEQASTLPLLRGIASPSHPSAMGRTARATSEIVHQGQREPRSPRGSSRVAFLMMVAMLVPATFQGPAVAQEAKDAATWSSSRLDDLVRATLGEPDAGLVGSAGTSTCFYDEAAQTVEILVDGPSEALEHVIRVGAGGEILFGGEPCGTATVDNTDEIGVFGTSDEDDVVIDLGGGPFEPGATPEETGLSEIEFAIDLGTAPFANIVVVFGSAEPDRIVLGQGGISLNADGDADVEVVNKANTLPLIITREGGDIVTARGGSGTGSVFRHLLFVDSGPGADRIRGGDGVNFLLAGRGNDFVVGGRKGDELFGGQGRDRVTGREGPDALLGMRGPDRLTGGPGHDAIAGGYGRDVLRGGPGDDWLHGGAAIDTCRPGPGRDRLLSCERS